MSAKHKVLRTFKNLAGETRFEHATGGFGDRCSTVEPLPYNINYCITISLFRQMIKEEIKIKIITFINTKKISNKINLPLIFCIVIFCYFAYSTLRVSLITLILICPGYSNSLSICFAISLAKIIESASEITSGLTITLISLPA